MQEPPSQACIGRQSRLSPIRSQIRFLKEAEVLPALQTPSYDTSIGLDVHHTVACAHHKLDSMKEQAKGPANDPDPEACIHADLSLGSPPKASLEQPGRQTSASISLRASILAQASPSTDGRNRPDPPAACMQATAFLPLSEQRGASHATQLSESASTWAGTSEDVHGVGVIEETSTNDFFLKNSNNSAEPKQSAHMHLKLSYDVVDSWLNHNGTHQGMDYVRHEVVADCGTQPSIDAFERMSMASNWNAPMDWSSSDNGSIFYRRMPAFDASASKLSQKFVCHSVQSLALMCEALTSKKHVILVHLASSVGISKALLRGVHHVHSRCVSQQVLALCTSVPVLMVSLAKTCQTAISSYLPNHRSPLLNSLYTLHPVMHPVYTIEYYWMWSSPM